MEKNGRTQVVVLVHGVRDYALWQHSVRTTLEEAGFAVESTNYGRVNLLEFLVPIAFFRRRAIETVWRQIRIVRQNNPDADVSVVAHSFGTYVIAHLIKENFDIKFDRILLCGSVVPYDFPFEQFQDRFRSPIINEVGARDVWPAMAENITFGYGSAGTYGFRRPLVRDRWHNGAGHNFFLKQSFCREFWVPFLKVGHLAPASELPEQPPAWLRLVSALNLRWLLLPAFLLLLAGPLVAAGAYLWRWQQERTTAKVIQPEIPATESYCSDVREVMATAPMRFEGVLGPPNGNNRIAAVPLSGWEDCIVYMETQFSDARRYNCTLSGFSDAEVATRSAEEIAKQISTQCLGPGFTYNKVPYPDGDPRFRVVGRGTKATVILRPRKDRLSPKWDISLDVE